MKKLIICRAILSLFLVGTIVLSFAQNQKDSLTQNQSEEDRMVKQMIGLSKTGENHKLLSALVGSWTFKGKHTIPNRPMKPIEFQGTVIKKEIWEGVILLLKRREGI